MTAELKRVLLTLAGQIRTIADALHASARKIEDLVRADWDEK